MRHLPLQSGSASRVAISNAPEEASTIASFNRGTQRKSEEMFFAICRASGQLKRVPEYHADFNTLKTGRSRLRAGGSRPVAGDT